MFFYELGGSGFESSWSHLTFKFRACFEQGGPWHSGNYRVWIHAETRTWYDKNIQSVYQLGIKGNFLEIITSLYSSTKVWLSYNSYVSTIFSTSVGLKQGDIFSTMFFNLFINDLPMLLKKRNIWRNWSYKPMDLFRFYICTIREKICLH